MYLLPLLRSRDRVRPEGDCHVPADPLERLLPWSQDALNELMNHSGTPQLRHVGVSVRAQREGGPGRGGDRTPHRHNAKVWLQQGPRWPIVPECSESKFGQGSS